jgi:hypothetical protein
LPDTRPGLNPRRLLRLMNAAIDRCQLDLTGRAVLTEAASGAYVVTPVLAAMAGADVCALAASTAYGSAAELRAITTELAGLAGVRARITFAEAKQASDVGVANIVTNSGQVRPIDAETIGCMKPGCVIPLMYEAWEFRSSDLDIEACRKHDILVAGTNEQHPAVDVFSYLGQMAVKQLHEAGIAVRGSRIALLCDNSFGPYIERELRQNAAEVITIPELAADALAPYCDAVVVAMLPGEEGAGLALTSSDARLIRYAARDTVVIQYWGDVDRAALAAEGLPVWPETAPAAGHMGVLPSAVGPDAIVRLQSGGLKVGEVLARGLHKASPEDLAFIQLL